MTPKNPRILHVEDNPVDALAFGLRMQSQGRVTSAGRLSTGLQHRKDGVQFDYIFLDLTLPDRLGPSAVIDLAQAYPEVPIVVLSELEPDWEVQSLRNGAVEVISKKENHRMELDSFLQRIQTRQQIQQAHREKYLEYEQMLKTVAHEIRTPLTGLLGFARLLEGTPLNDIQAEYVESIWESSHNMLCLVNDLLDRNRFQAGRLEISQRSFSLTDLLAQAVNSLRASCALRNLRLDLRIDPRLPQVVRGDDLRIGQVLTNLLGNSVKFTDRGGILLQCTLMDDSGLGSEKVRVQFSVKDSGRGIPSQFQESIFDEYRQCRRVDRQTGSGIGLMLCRQIVQSLGGEIEFESVEGAGSEFRFTIPLVAVRTRKDQFAPVRVLIVDDDHLSRSLVKTVVGHYGLECEEAGTARRAVELASQTDYELVLLDLELPDRNGLCVVDQLRKQGYAGPIVALSGHNDADTESKAIQAGVDEYLVKPLEPDMLREHLDCWLDYPLSLDRQRLATLKQLACRPSASQTVQQVIRHFLKGAATEIQQIVETSRLGLEQDTLRLTHLFKGSCATVGAYSLVKLLSEIEATPLQAERMQPLLEFKLAAVLQELAEFLESLQPVSGNPIEIAELIPISETRKNSYEAD